MKVNARLKEEGAISAKSQITFSKFAVKSLSRSRKLTPKVRVQFRIDLVVMRTQTIVTQLRPNSM